MGLFGKLRAGRRGSCGWQPLHRALLSACSWHSALPLGHTHRAITIAILRGRGPQWGWDLPEIAQYKVPEAEIGLRSPGALCAHLPLTGGQGWRQLSSECQARREREEALLWVWVHLRLLGWIRVQAEVRMLSSLGMWKERYDKSQLWGFCCYRIIPCSHFQAASVGFWWPSCLLLSWVLQWLNPLPASGIIISPFLFLPTLASPLHR